MEFLTFHPTVRRRFRFRKAASCQIHLNHPIHLIHLNHLSCQIRLIRLIRLNRQMYYRLSTVCWQNTRMVPMRDMYSL